MRFKGKRAWVTCAERYMGPVIADALEREGAIVFRGSAGLKSDEEVAAELAKAGDIDILVANFAEPPHQARVDEISDEQWDRLFASLVMPLMRSVRAVVPGMKLRGGGKIVAVTSAAPLRGIPNFSAYCAARGAQNSFVRAAGLELAANNIQLNAIGQNYVLNNVYYPPGIEANEKMQKHVRLNVPTGELASSDETAELALYLAGGNSRHMVGQVLPFAGGWATNA